MDIFHTKFTSSSSACDSRSTFWCREYSSVNLWITICQWKVVSGERFKPYVGSLAWSSPVVVVNIGFGYRVTTTAPTHCVFDPTIYLCTYRSSIVWHKECDLVTAGSNFANEQKIGEDGKKETEEAVEKKLHILKQQIKTNKKNTIELNNWKQKRGGGW